MLYPYGRFLKNSQKTKNQVGLSTQPTFLLFEPICITADALIVHSFKPRG
jgi:hypothetical protein